MKRNRSATTFLVKSLQIIAAFYTINFQHRKAIKGSQLYFDEHIDYFVSENCEGLDLGPFQIDFPLSVLGCCLTCYVSLEQTAKFEGRVFVQPPTV
jgi:hypothetical protein